MPAAPTSAVRRTAARTPPLASSTPSMSAMTAWPTGPVSAVPAEPACAVPKDAPTAGGDAGGPTLSAKRVAKAWRASDAGRSSGVTVRKLTDSPWSPVQPASAISVPGKVSVSVDFKEWVAMATVIFANPAEAAAKLDVIREMLREPCSYLFLPPDRYLVASLTRDRPDDLLVSGVFEKMPTSDLFVRVGNTITYVSIAMFPITDDEWTTKIRSTLSKA